MAKLNEKTFGGTMEYINPIIRYNENEYGRTADPYVLRYNNMYYHCYMKRDGVYITEAKELWNIGTGKEYKIFDDVPGAKEWFAPELYRINDTWYIYGAPDVNGKGLHCMCVLELKGDSPVGRYDNKGMVCGLENRWCIDGTILDYDNKRYFSWSDCGEIYIAEMDSPYSIKDEIVTIAKCAELDFEKREGRIIEGPAVLKKGNKIHIAYSVNESKSDEYCMGLLTYCGGDVLDANNWRKSPTAVFEKTDEVFGPGHCSFTTVNEDGKEIDYLVYHANLKSGSGWNGRCVFAQSFKWDENDMPVFGRPIIR